MSPVRSLPPNPAATSNPLVGVVLTPLALLLVLLLLLLAVPVDLAFTINGIRGFQGRISVRWLYGVVKFAIPVAVTANQRLPGRARQQPRKQRSKRKERRVRIDFVTVLRQAEFRQRAYRFFIDLIHASHPRRLRLLMRLGLGDPADTGCLWALVGPLSAAAQNVPGAHVRIEPEFMDSVLEVRADGQLRLVPLQLICLAIAFVLSPPAIRAWRIVRSGHA